MPHVGREVLGQGWQGYEVSKSEGLHHVEVTDI